MNIFLTQTGRKRFAQAFSEGLGLSRAERWFVTSSETRPGSKLLVVVLVSFAVSALLFVGIQHFVVGDASPEERTRTAQTVFFIVSMGTLLTLIFGSVFIIVLAIQASQRRFERAGAVAECSMRPKASLQSCHEALS